MYCLMCNCDFKLLHVNVFEGPGQFRDRSGPDHFRGGDFRRDRFPPRREGYVLSQMLWSIKVTAHTQHF